MTGFVTCGQPLGLARSLLGALAPHCGTIALVAPASRANLRYPSIQSCWTTTAPLPRLGGPPQLGGSVEFDTCRSEMSPPAGNSVAATLMTPKPRMCSYPLPVLPAQRLRPATKCAEPGTRHSTNGAENGTVVVDRDVMCCPGCCRSRRRHRQESEGARQATRRQRHVGLRSWRAHGRPAGR